MATSDLKGLNRKERDEWIVEAAVMFCAILLLLSIFLVVGWKTGQSDRCNLEGIIDE